MTEIAPADRTLATLTHLSGLAGYLIPLGGVIVPIIIWVMKKDMPVIAAIARQAVLLNVVVFFAIGLSAVLMLTIVLIPLVWVFWSVVGLAAIVLPIIGAIKAGSGEYYRYPLVGAAA